MFLFVASDERYAKKQTVLNLNATGKWKTQKVWTLSEPGMFKLVCDTAEDFSEWLHFTVMPAIRRAERYSMASQEMQSTSMTNVPTSYFLDPETASNPLSNRNRMIHLRSATFNLLHQISYYLVQAVKEANNRTLSEVELAGAVQEIMDVEHVFFTKKFCTNWISLYTRLAQICKCRLQQAYSTQMPIAHLYLYSFTRALHIPNCVPYEKEIEAFYGADHVALFKWEAVDYAEVVEELCANQPSITDFFQPQ
jgi:hypothetical protein